MCNKWGGFRSPYGIYPQYPKKSKSKSKAIAIAIVIAIAIATAIAIVTEINDVIQVIITPMKTII